MTEDADRDEKPDHLDFDLEEELREHSRLRARRSGPSERELVASLERRHPHLPNSDPETDP